MNRLRIYRCPQSGNLPPGLGSIVWEPEAAAFFDFVSSPDEADFITAHLPRDEDALAAIPSLPSFADRRLRARHFFITDQSSFPVDRFAPAIVFAPGVSFPTVSSRIHALPWVIDNDDEIPPPGDGPIAELISRHGDTAKRFAICLFDGSPSDSSMYSALAGGRVPIVVSDAMRLPFEDVVDYSVAMFRIGRSAAELGMLDEIFSITDEQHRRMAQAGMKLYDENFSRSGILRHIARILRASRNSEVGEVKTPQHEFPLIDRHGNLLVEQHIFQAIWSQLADAYPPSSSKALLFMGAGKFLKRFMEAAPPVGLRPGILGIADDSVTSDATFAGYRLGNPRSFRPDEFDAVFTATDSCEDLMEKRCREHFGESVTVLRPSALAHASRDAARVSNLSMLPLPGARGSFPRRLSGIVVCVNYGDYLSWTLPENIAHFDRLIVVTSPIDVQTQRIARQAGAEVVLSERYKDGGAVFNKGRMLNDGFAALDREGWVLVFDGDVFLPPGLRQRLLNRYLNRDCLHYAIRLNAPEAGTEAWLRRYVKDKDFSAELRFDRPGANRMPWGYFQLFTRTSRPLSERGNVVYPENFPNAGDVDYEFQARWESDRKILLPEAVVHIPHGSEGSNWSGRTSRKIGERRVVD